MFCEITWLSNLQTTKLVFNFRTSTCSLIDPPIAQNVNYGVKLCTIPRMVLAEENHTTGYQSFPRAADVSDDMLRESDMLRIKQDKALFDFAHRYADDYEVFMQRFGHLNPTEASAVAAVEATVLAEYSPLAIAPPGSFLADRIVHAYFDKRRLEAIGSLGDTTQGKRALRWRGFSV